MNNRAMGAIPVQQRVGLCVMCLVLSSVLTPSTWALTVPQSTEVRDWYNFPQRDARMYGSVYNGDPGTITNEDSTLKYGHAKGEGEGEGESMKEGFYTEIDYIESYNLRKEAETWSSSAGQPPSLPNLPDLTAEKLETMLKAGVGIMLWESHGHESDWLMLENWGGAAWSPENAYHRQYSLNEAYGGGFSNIDTVFTIGVRPDNETVRRQYSFVTIGTLRTAEWARRFCSDRQGMSIIATCEQPSVGYTAFNSMASLGWADLITAGEALDDLVPILDLMNGTLGGGDFREFSAACAVFRAGPDTGAHDDAPFVTSVGGQIELCPVVEDSTLKDGPGVYYPMIGGGIVTFSSPMKTDPKSMIVPGDHVKWQKTSDDGKGGAPHWIDDPPQHRTAKFCYWIDGLPGRYQIRVKGMQSKAQTISGDLYLDGDKIAPNQDDYVIEFKVKCR